ncbi:hypothetical protein LY28_02583 [Ruminiclostridium sufflavum DSM 19573]|uniref:Uncharacterized protein n=1 Tax=Ruminiclostridium sufflavum DSM 19573 TaxID=1121337 RepID=A0A318Y4L1_9FIRM|nr:hypothetical protein [Ruminiclostridium sufflavum]PYG86961.1 hypothetical protein LY28_02583 [Ruminiclostridium sufflavum DSM 19573]
MEYFKKRLNSFLRLMEKTNLISMDFIYRLYFMQIFGSKLYYRHKVTSYRSCAFCRYLSYDKLIKKYICSHGEYEACSSLLPCIIPDSSYMSSKTYIEEEAQTPWLFKETCLNFEVLDFKHYFRNFVSFDLNSSVIKLEALEGIVTGQCTGSLPCHICACVNKELYNHCSNIQNSLKAGKCIKIYDTLNKCFSAGSDLSKVS